MRMGFAGRGNEKDIAGRGNGNGRTLAEHGIATGNGNGRTRNGSLPFTGLINSRDIE
jgi:hypothetical protein